MSVLTRLSHFFKGKRRIRVRPDMFGASILDLAGGHLQFLEKTLLDDGTNLEEADSKLILAELLRAYFCLVSLHIANYFKDGDMASFYGSAVLNSLRRLPEQLHDASTSYVRDVFLDDRKSENAIACYVRGKPSEADAKALDRVRLLLRLRDGDVVHSFAGKLHVRVMTLLGIGDHDRRYLAVWYANAAAITSAAKIVFQTELTLQ